MKTNILLLVLSFFAFTACQNKKTELNNATNDTAIKVDSVVFRQQTEPIITKDKDTVLAKFSIKYPKLSGSNELIMSKINNQIEQFAKNQVFSIDDTVETTKTESIALLAKGFLNEFENNNKENEGNYLMGWEYDGSGDTLYISPKVISIYYNVYSFMGGAHGNSNTNYLNFNAKTGDLLKLTDIVSDTTALKKLAEMKFVKSQTSFAKNNGFEFDKKDYFWDRDFYLPANIGINKNGLQFLYNPYEAAAYALGTISFDLSWKELEGIVKKEILEE